MKIKKEHGSLSSHLSIELMKLLEDLKQLKIRAICICLFCFVMIYYMTGLIFVSPSSGVANPTGSLLGQAFEEEDTSPLRGSSAGANNSSNIREISCPTYEFHPRPDTEAVKMKDSWNDAKSFVRANNLTFLKEEELQFHEEKLTEIEHRGVAGMILECGVAKAGSSIAFASVKHPDRCLHLFDTFEGIPEPSKKDGNDIHKRYKAIQRAKQKCARGDKHCDENYYGNMKDLLGFDKFQFERAGFAPQKHHVYFHKGLFDDTVWPVGQVAYAHLDGDWYDSTMGMLKRISPFLSIGAFVVLDDVFHWSGARSAFVDYFNVDNGWFKRKQRKECFREQAGSKYLVFNHIKVGVKVLGPEEGKGLTPCPPKAVTT